MNVQCTASVWLVTGWMVYIAQMWTAAATVADVLPVDSPRCQQATDLRRERHVKTAQSVCSRLRQGVAGRSRLSCQLTSPSLRNRDAVLGAGFWCSGRYTSPLYRKLPKRQTWWDDGMSNQTKVASSKTDVCCHLSLVDGDTVSPRPRPMETKTLRLRMIWPSLISDSVEGLPADRGVVVSAHVRATLQSVHSLWKGNSSSWK